MSEKLPKHIEKLKEKLPKVKGEYKFNTPLAKMTWFKVGGNADVLYYPKDMEDLSYFLKNKPKDLPVFVLGGGSNILIRDGGFRGITIKLGNEFSYVESIKTENKTKNTAEIKAEKNIKVGGATLNSKVYKFCFNNSIGDFEFLGTIPGSIGGAIRMNAGCHEGDVSKILISAKAVNLDNGDIITLNNEDFGFVYRGNSLKDNLIFVEGIFKGTSREKKEIQDTFDEYMTKRKNSQPMGAKTCGCTFKNPKNTNVGAWKLIDNAGFRGYKLGDAKMSEKHTNFMINDGDAKADDLESLGELIQKEIKENTGIELEWEIQRIGNKLESQHTEVSI